MQVVIDLILPVFSVIAIGFIAGKTKIVSANGAKTLNDYVLYITLPALLFHAVATAPLSHLTNWDFLFANLFGIIGVFLITVCVVRFVFKKRSAVLSLYGMNASYGTSGFMGIPLLIVAFGQEAALPAAIATVIHNIPVIAVVILTFEWSRAKRQTDDQGTWDFLKSVFKPVLLHPIMISVILGLVFALARIPLPNTLDIFAGFLADATGPTALFAIGLALVNQKEALQWSSFMNKEIHFLIVIKTVLQPLLTIILVLFVFDLDPLWAITAILMSALPIGPVTFVLAQKYESITKETMIGIVLSLLISVITISVLFVFLIDYYSIPTP